MFQLELNWLGNSGGNWLDGFLFQPGSCALLGGSISFPKAERVRETWHAVVLQHSAPLEARDSS